MSLENRNSPESHPEKPTREQLLSALEKAVEPRVINTVLRDDGARISLIAHTVPGIDGILYEVDFEAKKTIAADGTIGWESTLSGAPTYGNNLTWDKAQAREMFETARTGTRLERPEDQS